MRLLACVPVLILAAGCRSEAPRQAVHRPSPAAAQPARTPRRFAVLVNGDWEPRHKDNILLAYRTLRTLGFEESRIFALTPRDRRRKLPGSALRFAPTADNYFDVIDKLAETVTPGDLVLIYGTGHGDTDAGDSLLVLPKSEIWPEDLRETVEALRGDTVIVMDQCFSGGFARALAGTKARAMLMSSVDGEHETDCYYFAQAFWKAFLHPERADRNRDGKTSVREAFAAALDAHHKGLAGDPELSADGACRTFNGLEDALLN